MASIKKLSNGSYQATIYIGKDENGKRINKYVTRQRWHECKKAAQKIEQENVEGKLTNVDNIRVAEWVKGWLEIHKNKYSPSTYVLYLGYLKNHYKPFFNQTKFKDLREIHLKKFLNELLGKMSSTSARRVMSCLRPILYDAMKDRNPMRDIKNPKEKKVDYSTIPTPEQFKLIHKAVKGTRDEPIILLAAWCGLRREEIFALKPNDLDFKENSIRIDEAYVINDQGKYELKDTKSENGVRDVSSPPYLMDLLKNAISNGISPNKKKPKTTKVTEITSKQTKDDSFIFPMRPDSYSSYLAKLVDTKGMPKTRLHFLRHYHATWLCENDVLDQLAAERLGHDVKMLRAKYQHLGVEKKKKINQRIIELQQNENI